VRPVFIAIANHGLLCFCHMANEALIPLFYATPLSLGGLGLKSAISTSISFQR
jgi:hypothetical protein